MHIAWNSTGDYLCIGDDRDNLALCDMRNVAAPRVVAEHRFEFELNQFAFIEATASEVENRRPGRILLTRNGAACVVAWEREAQDDGGAAMDVDGEGDDVVEEGDKADEDEEEGEIEDAAADKAPAKVVLRTVRGPFRCHLAGCIPLALSKSGRKLVIGGEDGLASIWDAEQMCATATVSSFDSAINAVALSSDDRLVAVASSADSRIDIASASSGRVLHSFKLPASSRVYGVTWHASKAILAVGCDRGLELFG